MSEATIHRPPLQEVFTPHDAEQVADYLAQGRQRRRWGRFLAAKHALLAALGRAREIAVDLVERYRLGGAVQAVKTTLGWLAGGYRLLRRGLEIVGMASAVGMVIASPTIRNLIDQAGAAVRRAVHTAASYVGSGLSALLGLFGARGRAVGAWINGTAAAAWASVRTRLAPAAALLQSVLDVRSVPMRTLGTLARERAVGRLLGALLPAPWALIARLVAGVLLLPRSVRQEISLTVLDVLSRVASPATSAATVPSGGSGSRGSTRVTTVPSGPDTREWERLHEHLDGQLDLSEGPLPPRQVRNPGKRRSGPRR